MKEMRRGRWRESEPRTDCEDEIEQGRKNGSDRKGKGMRIKMATETIGGDG